LSRTKRWNCVVTHCGKTAGLSLREARRKIGYSIHLKLPLPQWCDCLASNRPKLFPVIGSATTLLVSLAGCSGGVLQPQGPIGAADTKILFNALGIMLAIVVPTIVAVLAIAWWFRASNTRARYLPDWVFSGRIELLVWGIPLLVILFLGGVIWLGAHELDPYRPIASQNKSIEVQVVSLDWKWLFIYPDQGIASVNELVVPAGVPVHFSLTSASVMNMFFVPRLGSMIATTGAWRVRKRLRASSPSLPATVRVM
jgi:cytochrome o ubiquinol oxidase subunit II